MVCEALALRFNVLKRPPRLKVETPTHRGSSHLYVVEFFANAFGTRGVPLVQPARVVVLSDQSAMVGGAEALALLSAQLMADAGVDVTFIAGDAGEHCPLDRSKIEMIVLGDTPAGQGALAKDGMQVLYNTRAKALIEGIVAARDTPETVYHLHNWSKILSPAVFWALRVVSSRLFISAHDFSLVCPNLSYTDYQQGGEPCPLTPLSPACVLTHCDRKTYAHKLLRVARSVHLRFALDLAKTGTLIGIIHADMAEYFIRGGVPHDRLRVVRNPVKPYTATRVQAEANSDLFFVGRVVHEKGVDLAAEAARLTGRRLRVIGDGAAREDLERHYPNVVFEGWRSHEEIASLMKEARALIVSSRLPETFTLVAHEAMRSGVPVVAFSDVDCREAAEVGAAIVVPPREATSLAEGIRRLDDDEAAAQMSQMAFELGPRFSNTAETWAEELLHHYSELLRSGVAGSAATD
jgi:glycosyltransferase involved in cell wall biosynthesis